MSAAGVAAISADCGSKFLEGLATPDRDVILAAATKRRFLVKSVVVNQGDPAERVFLLIKGRARFFFITQTGRKILLHWLPPGEVFGGAALLSRPSPYLVSTETLKDSSVLVWERTTIRALATRYPKLLDNALLIASDYFAWHLASHVALTCHTARQRLAQALVSLARAIGQEIPGGIELDVTNEEIANAANVTPFTASRIFSRWRRNGVVTKSRGKILLHSQDRLA
jgi:CRP/FNR family transcriptional regulator, nitrogen oxide reductase regulator